MKFASTHWLWALLAVPVTYWIFWFDEMRRQRKFQMFAEKGLWRTLAPEIDPNARLRKARVWLLAITFIILALARPQWGTHEEVAKMTGLDIMIALDLSNSMEVEDVVPSRLKKAKHLIRTIVERLGGDRVGVVGFAASSYVACPLTTDLEYVLNTVDILTPKSVVNQGTDIGIGLETALRSLDRGAEMSDDPNAANATPRSVQPVPSRVVLLITDGEDHEEGTKEAIDKIKKSGTKLFILGIGTERGGPIPVRDESGTMHGYKKDSHGQPIVSTFKPNEMVNLAATADGKYWTVTAGESEVDEILQAVGAMNRTEYAERRYLVYEDRFQFPLSIGVILLFLEMGVPVRRRINQKNLAVTSVLFLLFALTIKNVEASQPTPMDTYLDNEKGIKAFQKGDVEGAKKEFGAAQARDPSRPELQYNQGVVQLKEGDLDGAILNFQSAARSSMESGNSKLLGNSLYNLGIGFTKKGDVKNAIKSYIGAIGSAKVSKNPELEESARKNLELLRMEQQKQKQQKQDQQNQDQQNQQKQQNQQSQQNQQKQDQNKNQEGQKNQQNKSGEDQNEQKKQAQRYQDPSRDPKQKQSFKSTKLNREDADRVMAQLRYREGELEKKLKKQDGRQQINQKDW